MKRPPIRAVSRKRQSEYREYLRLAAEFKARNPVCWVQHECGGARTTDCHHRVPRARWRAGYLLESNWVAACAGDHAYIHAHPRWAAEAGWLANAPLEAWR